MKRVPADEFAEHADEYLEAGEQISVEKDGRVIGHYLPVPAVQPTTRLNGPVSHDTVWPNQPVPVDPDFETLSVRLQRTLDRVYAETGLTEDEFADLMDPKKPFPYDKAPKA